MKKKPLKELLDELEQELLRLGYNKGSMALYKRQWHKLLAFAQEQGEIFHSEKLIATFIAKHFNTLEKDSMAALCILPSLGYY